MTAPLTNPAEFTTCALCGATAILLGITDPREHQPPCPFAKEVTT